MYLGRRIWFGPRWRVVRNKVFDRLAIGMGEIAQQRRYLIIGPNSFGTDTLGRYSNRNTGRDRTSYATVEEYFSPSVGDLLIACANELS